MKRLGILIAFLFIAFGSRSQTVDSLTRLGSPNTTIQSKKIDFDWSNLLSAIIGGLIGLTPAILASVKRSQIKGKIISNYGNIGNTPGDNQPSSIYFQKMSVFAMNKSFSLQDIKVFIKFLNRAEIECKIWTWKDLIFTFSENNTNVQRRLNISANEYLLHYTIFPKDQSITGYVSFSLTPAINESPEYIRYVFVDFKSLRKELKITESDIKSNALIHDNSIWI